MTTIMEINSGKTIVEEEYGDEVLNANWLPPQSQPKPQPTPHAQPAEPERPRDPPPLDADSFLQAVYRYQE